MNETFYQACFTRVNMRGWQCINTSSKLDATLYQMFERTVKSSDITPRDERHQLITNPDGTPLVVTKVVTDERTTTGIGFLQTQYSGADETGRGTLFCHGFLFEDAYGMLRHPEVFLSISEDNFHYSEEETLTIPQKLLRKEVYMSDDIERLIMEKYNISQEQMSYIIKCALYPFIQRMKSPIYIKTDGSRELAKDLMIMIYRSLPYSLRSKVAFSTYRNRQERNDGFTYIFTDTLPPYEKYFDPFSSENNILDKAYQKKLEANAFLLEYASTMPHTNAEHQEYYDTIETLLENMGNIYITKLRDIHTVLKTREGAISDEDLDGLFADWLQVENALSENYIKQIDDLLQRVITAKMIIDDWMEDKIWELTKESFTQSQIIYIHYVNYLAMAALKNPDESGLRFDNVKQRDTELFHALKDELLYSIEGRELLKAYFEALAKDFVKMSYCSYKEMEQFLYECKGIDTKEIESYFAEACFSIAQKKILQRGDFVEVYKEYRTEMEIIAPNAGLYEKELADLYNEQVIKNFDQGRYGEYVSFYNQYGREYKETIQFLRLWSMARCESEDNFKEYCKAIYKYFLKSTYPDSEKATSIKYLLMDKRLEKYLIECVFSNPMTKSYDNIEFWEIIAQREDRNLAETLATHHVSIIYDERALNKVLKKKSSKFNDLETLEKFLKECEQARKKEAYADIYTKEFIQIIKDRTAELKKKEREEKKTSNPFSILFGKKR